MGDTAIVPVDDDAQEEMKIETYRETFDCLVEMKVEVIGLDGEGLVSLNSDESAANKKRNAARDACAKATEMITNILKPIADKLNPEDGSIRITFIGSTKAAPASTRIDREELKKQLNEAVIEQAGLNKEALQKKFDELKNKTQTAGLLPAADETAAVTEQPAAPVVEKKKKKSSKTKKNDTGCAGCSNDCDCEK